MNTISQIQPNMLWQEAKKESIAIRFFDLCSADTVVKNIARIQGQTDLYCWYEGTNGLPQSGATFMQKAIFEALYALKKDVKLCLYSLSAWNFKKTVSRMPVATPLGEAINRINHVAIEYIHSSQFFQYCAKISKESGLYSYVRQVLPKKEWLFKLSEGQKKRGMTVSKLFEEKTSLFDCIAKLDVAAAYSAIQYIEAYYLIQSSVKRGLEAGQKRIEIAFVLPNDEGKYYLDLPKDLENMLRGDFGQALKEVEVCVSFHFFKYGQTLAARPYIDKTRKVEADEICSYFDYLQQPMSFQCRDLIHHLNDGLY